MLILSAVSPYKVSLASARKNRRISQIKDVRGIGIGMDVLIGCECPVSLALPHFSGCTRTPAVYAVVLQYGTRVAGTDGDGDGAHVVWHPCHLGPSDSVLYVTEVPRGGIGPRYFVGAVCACPQLPKRVRAPARNIAVVDYGAEVSAISSPSDRPDGGVWALWEVYLLSELALRIPARVPLESLVLTHRPAELTILAAAPAVQLVRGGDGACCVHPDRNFSERHILDIDHIDRRIGGILYVAPRPTIAELSGIVEAPASQRPVVPDVARSASGNRYGGVGEYRARCEAREIGIYMGHGLLWNFVQFAIAASYLAYRGGHSKH